MKTLPPQKKVQETHMWPKPTTYTYQLHPMFLEILVALFVSHLL